MATTNFRIPFNIFQDLIEHASSNVSEEVCGLLAGKANRVVKLIRVENSLHSPIRYRMDSKQELHAILSIEDEGLDLLAIYHTHPNGPGTLSETDLRENNFPSVLQLLVHQKDGIWQVNAYTANGMDQQNVNIEILNK